MNPPQDHSGLTRKQLKLCLPTHRDSAVLRKENRQKIYFKMLCPEIYLSPMVIPGDIFPEFALNSRKEFLSHM